MMRKYFFSFTVFSFLAISSRAQFDTAYFYHTAGSFHCSSSDSSELFKDTLVFCDYETYNIPFMRKWNYYHPSNSSGPDLRFESKSDSLIFIYSVSVPENPRNDTVIDLDEISLSEILASFKVVKGTWKYGKNNSTVEANFPKWKTTLTWRVENHKEYWLFIREK
jgi:hypothetical protein